MKNVLLVEDDAALVKAYSLVFEKEGIDFDVALDGLEAVELTEKNDYKVILLDILLPNMSGIEFLKQYHAKSHPGTSVLMFTNLETDKDRQISHDEGAVEYIVKANTTPHEIASHVQRLLVS